MRVTDDIVAALAQDDPPVMAATTMERALAAEVRDLRKLAEAVRVGNGHSVFCATLSPYWISHSECDCGSQQAVYDALDAYDKANPD